MHIQSASDVGNRALWVVCVLMAISSIAFYGMAMRVPVQKRLFHIITAFITTFAFLSYFSMATGDGLSLHQYATTETKHHVVTEVYKREVYWARYVDWSLTTPLLLLDLCLLAGLNGASITVAVVSDVIMIMTGLFAAFGQTGGQRWGWYAIACIAYLVVIYQLGYNGRYAVSNKDNKTRSFFSAIAGFTFVLWTLYPIVWGVADGARIFNVDTEIIAYAILDILAKPIFGFWLLFTHDSMSRTSPTVDGFWAHGMQSEGALRVGDDRD
ncbi:bacteriorhodopsin [Pseudomassariella vexata]|uniref:Bacteriorhodopsin n=1 Tax=Pseudomassariella vexata TaxID=1141098 RepID=A0A1Y2E1T0_9PEZI|nr:bacteriorhodopsin [Pseudomassariella vexata]ORY64825.1 bacteriorhodopsin [Pseudomassariella vexata]